MRRRRWTARRSQERCRSAASPPDDLAAEDTVDAEGSIAPPLAAPLTSREKEVLQGIAAGWSDDEIAERLQISLSTAKVTRAQQLSLLEE